MKNHQPLFEFLLSHIEVQIKKYAALASVGQGPDAFLNAMLVFNEVNELLVLTSRLFYHIHEDSKYNDCTYEQTRFYLEQEWFRAEAGWLMSPNPIHTTLRDRIKLQMGELYKIAESNGLQFSKSEPAQPLTQSQMQCEHDSYEIALNVMRLALAYRADPEKVQPNVTPYMHQVFKMHATGRYVSLEPQIRAIHEISKAFLKTSKLKKSESSLNFNSEPVKVRQVQEDHERQLNQLIELYQKIKPDFTLKTHVIAVQNPLGSFAASGRGVFSGIPDSELPPGMLILPRQEATSRL